MDRAGKRSIQIQVGEPVSLVGLLTGRRKGSYTTRKSLGWLRDYQKSIVYFLHMKEGVQRWGEPLPPCTRYDMTVCVYSSLTWYIDILNLNLQSCCYWWYKPQSPAINHKVMLIGHIWWGCHACDHSCSDWREQSMSMSSPEEWATQHKVSLYVIPSV